MSVSESSSPTISSFLLPDFNILDANGQSVLSLCLWSNSLDLAKKLIDHNANKNITDNDGFNLLRLKQHFPEMGEIMDRALEQQTLEADLLKKACDVCKKDSGTKRCTGWSS